MRIAIDSCLISEDGKKVNDFLRRKGFNGLSSYRAPPGMEGIREYPGSMREFPCNLYDIPNFSFDLIKELIKEIEAEKPYAEPAIFINYAGDWKMIKEEKKSEPLVLQNITAENVGQIAGHDVTINAQYLEPQNYLNMLEQAIQNDSKFSSALPAERESLLSKIKDLKNDAWVSAIGSGLIVEAGKKVLGL